MYYHVYIIWMKEHEVAITIVLAPFNSTIVVFAPPPFTKILNESLLRIWFLMSAN